MASLRVLVFDHKGCPLRFDTWLDDLQLYLLSDSRDSISLFNHTFRAATAPPATADNATHNKWPTLNKTLLWHHRLGHPSLPRLRGMHSRLLVSVLPRSLPPLPPSPTPPCLPCVEGRQRSAPHSSSFPPTTAPLQTLHMDLWGPARVSGQGCEHYFLLVVDDYTRYTTVFPLRSKGRVAVCLQLRERLWPRVSFPETSPTLRWTGKVGDALVLRVWSSRAFVHDTSADKLFARTIPCVFLGLTPYALGWQFYHPTSRRVFLSQDVTFDESVPFYRLFPYHSAPPLPPPLFLAPSPPPIDPLPPQGPAPSGVSQVDHLPETAPIEVAFGLGAARGAAFGGAAFGGLEPGGAEPEGVEPGGAESKGAVFGGAEPQGATSSGGLAGASPRLSPQQLHEWLVQRARLRSGATGAGGAGAAGAGGPGVTAGAGGTRGTAATGGARTRGTGAAGTGGVGGARAGDPMQSGAAGAGGSSAGGAGAGGAGAGGTGARGAEARGAGVGGTGTGGTGAGGTDAGCAGVGGTGAGGAGARGAGAVDPGGTCPLPNQSQLPLQPASPLPAPSPYTEHSGGLTERCEPASRPVSPVCTARRIPCSRPPPVPSTHAMALRPSSVPMRVPLPAPPESSLFAVPNPESDHARATSPTVSNEHLVAESDSVCPPSVGGECALSMDVLEDRQEEFQCSAAALPHLVSTLIAPEGDPDAPDIPTPRSYAEAIEGPYSSQWQAAMDAEMASWKSTGTYVDEVPPPGANIVSGMWIFRVKRLPGSPPVFKARYVARGFSQRHGVDYFQTFSPTPKMTTLRVLLHVAAQRDYELHSLDFSTAFLQGSLHEEIWLRRPPGFTGSFPPGTQWSLRWPVYGLRQAPREWHDTLRTTLVALGFAPSTADPSLFLRTDTSLPPFYVLEYVDDLVFATADTAGLAHVKSELQKRHTCTDLGELRSYLGLHITRDRAQRTITLTQSHMVQQVLQRFNFTYSSPQATPLSTRHSLWVQTRAHREDVEPEVHPIRSSQSTPFLVQQLHELLHLAAATQRSSQGYTFSLGSGSVSWRSTRSSSVLSSSCEAEIYAGAMAAQELRWLTYLLTDLGELPRSPPVLYVDNKAMLALCREHRLEHRTKHIALRYFLARELQQRGQLRLAYVAS
ncbi:unnamed protein product [Closterium sp. NIES-54]